MTLQFDASPYLAAFKTGQEAQRYNQDKNLQAIQSIGGIGQGIQQYGQAQQQDRMRQLQLYDPSLTDAANSARISFLATGKIPDSYQQPDFSGPLASNSLSQNNPNPPSAGMQPQGQMASAGMPDTGWGQENQPSSMPPIPQPTPQPPMGQQPIGGSSIVAAHKDYLSKQNGSQPQGMSALFAKKPFDVNAELGKIKSGDYSGMANWNPQQAKTIEATPQYAGVLADAKRKQEPNVSVSKAVLMFPHLAGKESALNKEYPDGIPQQDLGHFASGVKIDMSSGEKSNQFYQKEWDKIYKEANALTSSGRSPLGLATKADYNANRALKTINKPLVTNQDAGNAMADLASIYQNGTATQFGMSEQAYKTVYGKIQGVIQSISGKPQDALTDPIKKHLIDVIKDMKETNNDVIQQNLDSIETAQPDVISHFQKQWDGLRAKYKGGVAGGPQNTPGAATHRWNPQTGQVEVIQ